MELITNPKIGYKRYPGFSLLFDNPGKGHSLSPMGTYYRKMDCRVETEPTLDFYQTLETAFKELELSEKLTANYFFFTLPSFSYHVTVFDGLNQGHLINRHKRLSEKYQQTLEDFLIDLPHSFREPNPFLEALQDSSLIKTNRTITFEFDQLANWSGNGLVARLKTPAGDQASDKALGQITSERKEQYRIFINKFYPAPENMNNVQSYSYTPHVSLGYFGNIEKGNAAQAETEHWTDLFKQRLGNKTITFKSISLYGFTDMITFFKLT